LKAGYEKNLLCRDAHYASGNDREGEDVNGNSIDFKIEGEIAFPIDLSGRTEGDAKGIGFAASLVDGEAASENLTEDWVWKRGMNSFVVMQDGTGALRNGNLTNQKAAVEIVERKARVGAEEAKKCRLDEDTEDLDLGGEI
jgi:hypothetical protein